MSELLKTTEDVKIAATLDVNGLNCPLPLLLIKKTVTTLSSGDILQVNGLQSGFRSDFKGWCERNGHFFIGEKDQYGNKIIFIKKG